MSNLHNLRGYRIVLQADPNQLSYVVGSAAKSGTSHENDWNDIRVNQRNVDNNNELIFASFSNKNMPFGKGTLFKFKMRVSEKLKFDEQFTLSFSTDSTEFNEGEIISLFDNWAGHTPFKWGDVSGNGTISVLDSSIVLQHVLNSTTMPIQKVNGFTKIDNTELPLLADLNNDQKVGTTDASLMQDFYTFLIDSFDAVDNNRDLWGPDLDIAAKVINPIRFNTKTIHNEKQLVTSVEHISDEHDNTTAWKVTFSTDNPNGLRGILLDMQYDPKSISLSPDSISPQVNSSQFNFVTNDSLDGKFRLVGAFSPVLYDDDSNFFSINMYPHHPYKNTDEPITIHINNTIFNDDEIPLHPDSDYEIILSKQNISTQIPGWMLY